MPRPILKRGSLPPPPLETPPAVFPFTESSLRHVNFPLSPRELCSTQYAHSTSTYDRSPIVVDRNSCAMPERGCPGRTFTEDARLQAQRHGIHRVYRDTLHPRAMPVPDDSSDSDDDEEQHTPTNRYSPPINHYNRLPPPLPTSTAHCPDLCSSSSSESDESSDGFASPPPEVWNYPAQASKPYPYNASPPYPSYDGYVSTTPTQDRPLSFLPHPNPHSPPDEAPRSPERRRRPQRDGGDAATVRKKKSPSLCRAMTGLGFNEKSEDDCLGGF